MLLSIENYGEHLDKNEPSFLNSTDNIFHPPEHQKTLTESVTEGFQLSPKSSLAVESSFIPFDLASVNCIFNGNIFDQVNPAAVLTGHQTPAPLTDMDLSDLIKTDHPKVLCTRLPQHYRSNKSLPNTFAVIIRDFNIPNGTQVVISASNPENPNSALRNNTAVVSGVVECYGKIAKFSDLRFVGRSGRGKFFTVTISILSEPKIIAVYHRAIKVTVDGPRSSRKIGGPVSGTDSPCALTNGRLKRVSGGLDSRSENGSTSPESVASSMCQSPDLANLGYLTKMPPSVSPPTTMQSSSPYVQQFAVYQASEDDLSVSQSWPGSEKGSSNFEYPTFLNYSCGTTIYDPKNTIQYSIPQGHHQAQLFSAESGTSLATVNVNRSPNQGDMQGQNRAPNNHILTNSSNNNSNQGAVLPPVQTFQQPAAPVFQETSVTTRCISYHHPQMPPPLPQVLPGYFQQEYHPLPPTSQTQNMENQHQQLLNINQSMPELNTQRGANSNSHHQMYNNQHMYLNHQTPHAVFANEVEYKQTTRSLGYLNAESQFDNNQSYQNFLDMIPSNSLETFNNVHDNHINLDYDVISDVIKSESNTNGNSDLSGLVSNFPSTGGLTANTCQILPVSGSGDLPEEHVWRPY